MVIGLDVLTLSAASEGCGSTEIRLRDWLPRDVQVCDGIA